MAFRTNIFALGLSSTVFAVSALAAEQAPLSAPITDIRLSSGGLAEIQRQVNATDNAVIRINVPLTQIDDVLKSLSIDDPKGQGSSASLAGKEPLAEIFRNMPFRAEDVTSRSQLMMALQGNEITASGNGNTITGRIVSVESVDVIDKNGKTTPTYRLTIFANGKLVSLDLDGTEVSFNDASTSNKIETALKALQTAQSGGSRDVTINLKGTGNRTVSISYVVPAPVWKASYRLALQQDGTASIQGWAIIENTSSSDWNNIRLSLSSGSPVTLHQNLYEAYYAKRPEIPVYGPNGIIPIEDKGEMKLSGALHQTRPHSYEPNAKVPAAAPLLERQRNKVDIETPSPMASNDEPKLDTPPSVEADIATLFRLPSAITLEQGASLTVPFLKEKVTATRVSVFQPLLRLSNPIAGVFLENNTQNSFPPGILTLTDTDVGYVGDALLAGLPAGESRFVTFATDKKVRISSENTQQESILKVTSIDGSLRLSRSQRSTTTYKISSAADADRTIIIEHPRTPGVIYRGQFNTAETPTSIRMKVFAGKGQNVEASIIGEKEFETTFSLSDPEDSARALIAISGPVTDPILNAKIAEVSKAAARVSEKINAASSFDLEVERISNDQERIRENLQAIPANSTLAKTYLTTLSVQENRLAEISALRSKNETELQTAREFLVTQLKAF